MDAHTFELTFQRRHPPDTHGISLPSSPPPYKSPSNPQLLPTSTDTSPSSSPRPPPSDPSPEGGGGATSGKTAMGSSYRMCLCFTRKFRWSEAEPPPDVKQAFSHYAAGGNLMSVEQLRLFMAEVQREAAATFADADHVAQQIRSRRHPHSISKLARAPPSLTLDDFHHYLFSPDLNRPIGNQVHHDMTAPLSHYFIYTGHNSYLTGNQLSSDCSDAPIAKALDGGVRVIELDIWPNSSKDNVNVLHGRTLTSPVELGKCLRAIREHAFVASPYPVIITLEDHLTPDLQAKVAKMVTETFGDMLYYPESNKIEEFPSPESLKHRVIISTKPPTEYLAAGAPKDKENDDEKGKDSFDEEEWGKEVPDLKDALSSKDKNDGNQSDDDGIDDEDSDDDDDDNNEQTNRKHSAPEYRRLITIHAGKPKGGLKEALGIDPNKVRRLSLSEQQLRKAAESHGTDIVRFTQKNILRVYPKGTRITSSNYNPLNGWMHGAQMVAFNMQGYGRSLWLMQGFYRANGGCGYVKKPDFLMKTGPNNDVFDPQVVLPVKRTLKVKVYMGDGWRLDFKQTHFDMYSPPDFYTRVGIAGVQADQLMKKTKTIEDSWTPVWNEEFTFPLTVPELAVLRIEVHEHDMSEKDDFGGQICLPVSELKPGIRTIRLCNRKGVLYNNVKLLMRFEFY